MSVNKLLKFALKYGEPLTHEMEDYNTSSSDDNDARVTGSGDLFDKEVKSLAEANGGMLYDKIQFKDNGTLIPCENGGEIFVPFSGDIQFKTPEEKAGETRKRNEKARAEANEFGIPIDISASKSVRNLLKFANKYAKET